MRLCAYKPNSVEDYSSDDHIPGMNVAIHLVRLSIPGFKYKYFYSKPRIARPCTQVRILPFHPVCCHTDYPTRGSVCFRSRRHCSHLYVISDTTGVTRYLAPYCYGRVRTFLPSYLRRSSCVNIITQNYRVGSTTISPTIMACFCTKPATVSITYRASVLGTNIAG